MLLRRYLHQFNREHSEIDVELKLWHLGEILEFEHPTGSPQFLHTDYSLF